MAYKVIGSGTSAAELSPDILDALDGAASPDATNVFATMADVGGGGLTPDELAAVQGANTPSGTNVFATMLDVGPGGTSLVLAPCIAAWVGADVFPVAPAVGARYLAISAHPTEWPHADSVYEWNGATWDETAPVVGNIVWAPYPGVCSLRMYGPAVQFGGANGWSPVDSFQSVAEMGFGLNLSGSLIPQGTLLAVEPTQITGAVAADISAPYLIGFDDDNSDAGRLYCTRTWTAPDQSQIDVYKDAGRTNKLATGARSNDGAHTLTSVGGASLTGKITTLGHDGGTGDFELFRTLDTFPGEYPMLRPCPVGGTPLGVAFYPIASGITVAYYGRGGSFTAGRGFQVLVTDGADVKYGDRLTVSTTVPGRVDVAGIGAHVGWAREDVLAGTDVKVYAAF